MFRLLRNRVNRKRKACRAKYYATKIAHLKDCKPSYWRSEVKKLSGLSPASSSKNDRTNLLQHLDGIPDGVDLAKTINEAFLSLLSIFEPLPTDYESQQDNPSEVQYAVSADSVLMMLSALNPRKATGPDGIPPWLIKENVYLLVSPITDIIKYSFKGRRLPPS